MNSASPTAADAMDLSIIIVNWNSRDYLDKCVASILAETHGVSYEIIVIDAASFDGCDQMLRGKYPSVRFIQSEKNLGFAGANNVAFKAARGRSVLFLNPDTEVIGSAIARLHEQLQRLPDAGSVGCKLLNSDRTVQTSCIQCIPTIVNQLLDCEYLRARWPKSALWGVAPLYETCAEPKVVEAISGACVMLKREVFERIGCFSEDYFMYAEDIDLSYKVSRAGLRNYYVPDATVVHHGGGSTSSSKSDFSTLMMRQAAWLFLRKTRGQIYAFGYRMGMMVSAVYRLLALLVVAPRFAGGERRESWKASCRKWLAIFRWSWGLAAPSLKK
jgi:GT2 family glycosyltransferase